VADLPGELDAERLPVLRAHPRNQRPGQHAEILALQRRRRKAWLALQRRPRRWFIWK